MGSIAKNYDKIYHLPGSWMTGNDKMCESWQELRATQWAQEGDLVIVTEKMCGKNYGVAKEDGKIMALNRAGDIITGGLDAVHLAGEWDKEEDRRFAKLVYNNREKFSGMLEDGEVASGEFLDRSHGVEYILRVGIPFVVFDILDANGHYISILHLVGRCNRVNIPHPHIIHIGGPIGTGDILRRLGDHGYHNARPAPEGAVWYVENHGKQVFKVKFRRSDYDEERYARLGYIPNGYQVEGR